MNTPPPIPSTVPLEPAKPRDWRLLAAAAGCTIAADFLLWAPDVGGTAIGSFFLILAFALTLKARTRSPRLYLLLGLLSASAAQAFLQLKPSTIGLLVGLALALVGEAHFQTCRTMAGRILEAITALLCPFPGWRHLRVLFQPSDSSADTEHKVLRAPWRLVQIVLPALFLGVVFSMFFAAGNDVFRQAFSNLATTCLEWILHLDFTFGRLCFWVASATVALSLLRPATSGLGNWLAARPEPTWRRTDETLARWQSIAILVLLNALFCFVNTLDVVYLWSRAALPEGVNPSQFLHAGVESLIFAVFLSAVVLVVLFQQRLPGRGRLLHVLASLWVLQNFVLIAGVYLRLKLYIDDLQLTLLRIGVGLFLALVIVGFVLLTIYFWRGKSLGWLLRGNAVATFVLFFSVQFFDLNRIVADYNVGHYLEDHGRYPNLEYLQMLGSSGWPALIRLAAAQRGTDLPKDLRSQLTEAGRQATRDLHTTSWRRWELQPARRNQQMLDYLHQRHFEFEF